MRLIDVEPWIAEIQKTYCTGCDYYQGIRCLSCWVYDAIGLFDDAPTVDAIAMPKGRSGDVVEWNNGVEPYEPQLFQIMGIYIDSETVRYDLGYFCPTVNHPNIVRIIPHGERKDNES